MSYELFTMRCVTEILPSFGRLNDNKVKKEKLRGTLRYSVVHLINLWCINKITLRVRLLLRLRHRTWSVAWLPCYR